VHELTKLWARRLTITELYHDVKNHRYGWALCHALMTRATVLIARSDYLDQTLLTLMHWLSLAVAPLPVWHYLPAM
jgi:hypothetical protein